MSGDPEIQRSSLFGLVNFRPRITVVLVFLTLTVAVVGYHFWRDTGTRRVEGMAKEAQRIFEAERAAGTKNVRLDPAAVEEQIRGWVGVTVALPRDERLFSYTSATRERIGNHDAAAVGLTFGDDPYLLLVVRPDPFRGVEGSPLFSESSFLSWERGGNSFVSWERGGVVYFLVSSGDLTYAFDLVRQYLT
ncbi:MAG TPA: hypothetical protein VH660_03885 [Candidatus Deferrimicrobiaceae bacterium]